MKARTWGMGSLVGTLLAAMIGGGALAQAPTAPNQPAALVNGETITLAEVDALVQEMRRGLQTDKPPTDADIKQMRLEAAMILVDKRLMERFLQANGPKVTPKEVQQWLGQLEGSLKTQGHTLQDFCRERNLTRPQLEQNVVSLLQWSGYVNSRMTDAELKKYYEANRDFFEKTSLKASHIVIRIPSNAGEAERQQARAKLQRLRADLLAHKIDFPTAAKKYSQCPSAERGGDVGYFYRRGPLQETFTRAAFALKVGELSDVVPSDYGMHLILVTDRKEGPAAHFEHIKDFVKETYSEEIQQNVLEQQRKAARINILLETPPGVSAVKRP